MTAQRFRRIAAVVLIILILSACASCKLKEDKNLYGLNVVMSSKNVDLTLYDFSQSFYSNQYYQYFMFGLITQEDYIDMIIDDLSNFMYMLNAAYDAGVELTAEERDEIDDRIDVQLEQLLQSYEEQVPEGTENVREAAKKLLEEDLKKDGLDFASFMELAVKNLYMYKTADKYYHQLNEGVDVTDEEVRQYIAEQAEKGKDYSVFDFADMVNSYCEGDGTYPFYVPEDCFSVNHIYLAYDTIDSDDGLGEFDPQSRVEDEARIEAALPETAGFNEFMELVKQYGDDAGMENEAVVENGYIIHPSLDEDYIQGFVYAAMNLHGDEWLPEEDAGYEIPELTFFSLKDGTDVVKVKTEYGIHYLILNKEFRQGVVEYSVGDYKWESWKSALLESRLDVIFDEYYEVWKEQYPIEINMDEINAWFLIEEAESN